MINLLSRTFTVTAGVLATLFASSAFAAEVDQHETAVFNDHKLNTSLVDLNQHIQKKYLQDDMLASLDEAPGRDFVLIAEAVSNVPEMQLDFTTSSFGPPITNSSSLNSSLAHFNTEVLMRGEDLFVQVARAENDTGLSFADVAGVIDAYNESERAQALLSGLGDFGNPVHDDESLNGHLIALSELIDEFVYREELLAHAVPAIDGNSFDRYTLALALLVN